MDNEMNYSDRFHETVAKYAAMIPEKEWTPEKMANAIRLATEELDPNHGELIYEMDEVN